MFWDNFTKLCEERNKKPNSVATEIGCSSGSITAWKNGRLPRMATLNKIAEYFNVTVDFLLSNNEQTVDDQLRDEQFAFWGKVKDLTDTEKKDVLNFINYIKSQRNDKDDIE